MIISDFNLLFKTLSQRGKRHLVIANGVDNHSIEAAMLAQEKNIVTVTLTGNKAEIEATCNQTGISIDQFNVIDCADDQEATDKAVEMAAGKQADLIMKGLLNTEMYVKSILKKETGLLPEGALLTHVSVMLTEKYPKLLILGDVAIIPLPSFEQKVIITRHLIDTAHKLGIEKPKVAFIAATEKVIKKMPATVDADELKKLWENGQFPDSCCDGPMALDLAIDPESVLIKNYESPVAGDADCLLFPNIEAGNVFYKTNTKLGDAKTAALVVGTTVPVVLSSRGDSIETKLNSIALAALLG